MVLWILFVLGTAAVAIGGVIRFANRQCVNHFFRGLDACFWALAGFLLMIFGLVLVDADPEAGSLDSEAIVTICLFHGFVLGLIALGVLASAALKRITRQQSEPAPGNASRWIIGIYGTLILAHVYFALRIVF